jgi:c-di-GMP-binding flagellar brake protein YcgR
MDGPPRDRDAPSTWESRRRFPRYRLEATLLVTELKGGQSHTVRGRSRDLSEGGIGGFLAPELAPGQTVVVEFPLPSARQDLVLQARVFHHSGSHYGFEFVQASPVVLQDIRRACEALPIYV